MIMQPVLADGCVRKGFGRTGMYIASDDEADFPLVPEEAPLVYCVSYRVASGLQRVLCSAAGDAMAVALRCVETGGADLRATCDGVALTLSELREMASCESQSLSRPDLVWSG